MRARVTSTCGMLLFMVLAACESPADPQGVTARTTPSFAVDLADQYGATPLENLILQYLEDGVLTSGLANSLLVKAHAAFLAIEAGDLDVAERRLASLRAQVASLLAEGVLTEAQADALLDAAVDLRPLKDLLPGTWAFEGVGFCFTWQETHGTMTIDWIDREAGTFGGEMTYWYVTGYGGSDGQYRTGPIPYTSSAPAHMDEDGTITFSAPFQYQFSNPPQTGTFDGHTIRTSWTANCGPSSHAGGPIVHDVTYTRVLP